MTFFHVALDTSDLAKGTEFYDVVPGPFGIVRESVYGETA